MIIILLVGRKLTAAYILFGEQAEGYPQPIAWKRKNRKLTDSCRPSPVRRESGQKIYIFYILGKPFLSPLYMAGKGDT